MKYLISLVLAISTFSWGYSQPLGQEKAKTDNPPIYIAFLWHMHQPLYWPGETIIQTEAAGYYPYSVFDIHNERTGPYTSWPKNAVQKTIDAGLEHAGAQVSFSGSLIENLNNLEANGNSNFQNWKSNWTAVINQNTSLGNPRMDMIGFGYYHPLMGLLDYKDIRSQIQKHKTIVANTFGGSFYSKGIFPPENAFAEDMIPALVDEGIEWVLVDNIHFDRAAEGYPFSTEGNIYEPNKADVRNPDPNDWVQLNNLWAPTKISGQWGHQPHYIDYTNPETGEISKIIAVPTDRYMGNEDGRGGFGALQYDDVMSQLESYNTDPDHPILIVLHHDGDNYGGGSDGYYNSNFQAFVDWVKDNPTRFVTTTVQDYLEMFPLSDNDVIHVESGSWAGADSGDPEFKKWLGDPGGDDNYSPDRNSWGVITAAKNYVDQAESIDAESADFLEAKTLLLNAQASDYWYWDNSIDGIWDNLPTTASNMAIQKAQTVIGSSTNDLTPPTIFKPQREPYNPGGFEWKKQQPSTFTVWTYAFDVSGLNHVKLSYRAVDEATFSSSKTETFSQIMPSDTSWKEVDMTGKIIQPKTNTAPLFKAEEFSAELTGFNNVFIEYFVEAEDVKGNISRSLIQDVWVGSYTGTGSGESSALTISPTNPTVADTITISISDANQGAKLHWGVNDWKAPIEAYWPEGTLANQEDVKSVESPFVYDAVDSALRIKIGPFENDAQKVGRVDFVIHYDDDSWDNNNSNDYIINFGGSSGSEPHSFVMDGNLDDTAVELVSHSGLSLFGAWESPFLYLAAKTTSNAVSDLFLFFSDTDTSTTASPWSKAGTTAKWNAFLALERSNSYNSWFDNSGTASHSNGTYLEGIINIQEEFGTIPSQLFLWAAEYATDDGGAMLNQVPSGNGDANIDTDELYRFNYVLTSVDGNNSTLPANIKLHQNYPNPFNPGTRIAYELSDNARVTLRVFDILGREIALLENGRKSAGFHSVAFNAAGLSSGVYIYRLEVSGKTVDTKKMILLK